MSPSSTDTPQARGSESRERDRLRTQFPGPYAEGVAAYHDGSDLSDDPYNASTDAHAAWDAGYNDAEDGNA